MSLPVCEGAGITTELVKKVLDANWTLAGCMEGVDTGTGAGFTEIAGAKDGAGPEPGIGVGATPTDTDTFPVSLALGSMVKVVNGKETVTGPAGISVMLAMAMVCPPPSTTTTAASVTVVVTVSSPFDKSRLDNLVANGGCAAPV